MNKHQEKVLEAALEYAANGWRVLPVGKNKKPIVQDWTASATTDEIAITKWWIKYPSANIGIATGKESGIWVLDVDVHSDNGMESLKNHFGDRLKFDDDVLIQKTPTGGFHFFFKWDDEHPVKTTSSVLPGVDFRGTGGQIVVSPSSRNIDGQWIEYRFNNKNNKPSSLREWVIELIGMSSNGGQSFDVNKVLTGLKEGNRDEQIFRYAWHLKTLGIDYGLASGFIKTACEKATPPFDWSIAEEKLQRAYSAKNTNNNDIDIMMAIKNKRKLNNEQ